MSFCLQIRYTPLHAAAEAGQVGALLLMIEAGAFIDEQVGCRQNEPGLPSFNQISELIDDCCSICHVPYF
jgi:hypothetical protein